MKRFALALTGIFLAFSSHAIIPDRKYIRLPQQEGLIYRELDVVTDDGYGIETWFYPAQDMPGEGAGQDDMLPYRTLDAQKRPTLVICNGDAGNMSYQQVWMAEFYVSCGLNVVTFDWRGFGASSEFEMDPDYLCYTEMLSDYAAVVDEVRRQPEVDSGEIYLMGWSTGAYLSMITAYADAGVKGCILCGTPSSFEDAIPQLVKVHPQGKTEAELVVGSEDDRTPQWMSEKIFDALPDGIDKRLSVFEGAGHGGTEAPYVVDMERWFVETVSFLSDNSGE